MSDSEISFDGGVTEQISEHGEFARLAADFDLSVL